MQTFLREIRIYQWPKNFVVFAALVFAQQAHLSSQVIRSLWAFGVLCLASSAVYVFNDLLDIEKDRAHPDKCMRPLASGAMSVPAGIALMVLLGAASLVGAGLLNVPFLGAVVAYTILNILYSVALKNAVIIDALTVAIGFVVRAVAGAVALQVEFSNWLVVCTLFLALFLSLGKRRREIELMREGATHHREVLGHYSVPFLDALSVVMAGATLLTYTIYTCSPEVVERLGTDKLYLTLPFVVYGLFRYLYLVHHKDGGGDPTKELVGDKPLLITVLIWGLACVGIIYGGRFLE